MGKLEMLLFTSKKIASRRDVSLEVVIGSLVIIWCTFLSKTGRTVCLNKDVHLGLLVDRALRLIQIAAIDGAEATLSTCRHLLGHLSSQINSVVIIHV